MKQTLCEKLNIDDRLQQMQESETFIAVKEQKVSLIHYHLALLIHQNLILVK